MSPAILIDDSVEDGNVELSATRRRLIQKDVNTFYVFYKSSTTGLLFSKSTDALATWASAEVNAQTGIINQDVYYRRWNDRTLDDVIETFWDSDAATRGLYHCPLDLSDDSLGTTTQIQSAGAHPFVRNFSGAVAESERLYCAGGGHLSGIDPTTEYSDDDGATWTPSSGDEFPETNSSDILQIWPDFSSADPHDVSAIFLDASANALSVKQLDASLATITETAIASITYAISDTNLTSSFASNGHIRVAAVDTDASPASIKTWDVYGATVTAKTDVVTTTANIQNVALQVIDAGDMTVCWYVRGTGIYYKVSIDQMVSWGPETLLHDPATTVVGLLADPRPPTTTIAVAWITSSEELYTFFPAPGVEEGVPQYRLMVAEADSPDVPVLNITSQNVAV